MLNLGDRAVGSTLSFLFNTHKADGTPITLAGTPVVSVYKNSTTQSVTGVSLTVDYDSVTGMHQVVIDLSADGTFYATNDDFNVVITTGTVNSISVAGAVVAKFSIGRQNISHAASTAWASGAITAASIAADAIGADEIAAGAVTKIQAGLATPTNITAGTITTVTNLTNAPTNGDLTATMKASVNTEVDTALANMFTDGNNANIKLKSVSVINPVGDAVLLQATTVAGASGLNVVGVGDGSAAVFQGGDTGSGIRVLSGTVGDYGIEVGGYNKAGVHISSLLDKGLEIIGNTGGVSIEATTSGDGLSLLGSSAGLDLKLETPSSNLPVTVVGTVDANIVSIDGETTDGNNATLNLKQLNIQNSVDEAVVIQSTATDKPAVKVFADDADAISIGCMNAGNHAINIDSSDNAINIQSVDGDGIHVLGLKTGINVFGVEDCGMKLSGAILDLKLETPSSNLPVTVAGTIDANVVEINGSSEAARKLGVSADTETTGTVLDTDFDPTTTAFDTDLDKTLTDHYKDRWVLFTSGALIDIGRPITGYQLTSGGGRISTTAFPQPPVAGDEFIIV